MMGTRTKQVVRKNRGNTGETEEINGKGNMENRNEPNEKQAKHQGKHRYSPPETVTKTWGKFGKLEILKNH